MATHRETDFLKLNAYSIKTLINQKLAEDTKFTDQIYAGSNLATLIDIFSYIAQTMIYQLNSAAAESMWSDTQYYENINRLCQFLGYSPKGMVPSSVDVLLMNSTDTTQTESLKVYCDRYIPKYAYIDTGKSDIRGNEIYYSICESDKIDESNIFTRRTLYNGIWKLYETTFIGTGEDFQTITLNIKSDHEKGKFVAHDFFDIYVVENTASSDKKVRYFKQTSYQLFKTQFQDIPRFINQENEDLRTKLYSGIDKNAPNSDVFNVRLNENKEYEIKFGDNIHGGKPPKGSLIYIFYLDTNGESAKLEVGELYNKRFLFRKFNIADELYARIIGLKSDDIDSDRQYENLESITSSEFPSNVASASNENANDEKILVLPKIINVTESTPAKMEESVDEIRENAPTWFKMGNRLVTKDDYEYFIKTSPKMASSIRDVLCQSNWEYISTFYKWLYILGSKIGDSKAFLNQNRIIKNNYKTADPADANNIYLWTVTYDNRDDINGEDWIKTMEPVKDMTHEPIFLPAVKVRFTITAADEEEIKNNLTWTKYDVVDQSKTDWIEITVEDDIIYASSTIAAKVTNIIQSYFGGVYGTKIGQLINFNDIVQKIYEINGIVKIRTVHKKSDGTYNIRNGLCFASWSSPGEDLIDLGIDLEVGNMSRSLEPFQYALLADNEYTKNISSSGEKFDIGLFSKIKIIKRSVAALNVTEY